MRPDKSVCKVKKNSLDSNYLPLSKNHKKAVLGSQEGLIADRLINMTPEIVQHRIMAGFRTAFVHVDFCMK